MSFAHGSVGLFDVDGDVFVRIFAGPWDCAGKCAEDTGRVEFWGWYVFLARISKCVLINLLHVVGCTELLLNYRRNGEPFYCVCRNPTSCTIKLTLLFLSSCSASYLSVTLRAKSLISLEVKLMSLASYRATKILGSSSEGNRHNRMRAYPQALNQRVIYFHRMSPFNSRLPETTC